MSAISRKIGLRNEKFATKVASTGGTKTSGQRRTISFYVLAFLLFVLVCSGICEMLMHIPQLDPANAAVLGIVSCYGLLVLLQSPSLRRRGRYASS
ncbi:hypothetical protein BBBOND_0303830 [Babesia bigemina]|uniref:Uncharacterized protein n=1 Tax=Babesia bigemina TaxID=5866 RepID=A0A061DC28_BABBI|nr:hypothetical protein BBBOND_0303830 [Babesia bigemina]CDR96479.1 hypothetical protein BBBOND_0303830 [Babesia bigemina]|eukprot:XP_012768665.1 hypothetical protein BBBOND_0303830 [Babesia bigemina]